MGAASKAGDLVFKAFVGGLGVTTIYLTATFSANVYRGLSWHKAQSPKSCTSCSAGFTGPYLKPCCSVNQTVKQDKVPASAWALEEPKNEQEGSVVQQGE